MKLLLSILRWLLIVEIIIQPIIGTWMVIMAMRMRRDTETMRQFLETWGERILTRTKV